ncbi:MAG TPA: hypothetical protein VGF45_19205 [Polyangia bacterium]
MLSGTGRTFFRPRITLAAAAFMLFGASCAGLSAQTRDTAATNVDGVWEGFAQATIAEGLGAGDTRIERQSWHLQQDGAEVTGYYLIQLTMISGDGRPYVCSRKPQFQTVLRYEVRGQVHAAGVDLLEVGSGKVDGPCRPAIRAPGRFRAAVAGDRLTLRDGSYQMTLYRRGSSDGQPDDKEDPALPVEESDEAENEEDEKETEEVVGPTVPASLTIGGAPREEPVPVEGVWVWEHRGRVPTGDEKQEREEWHLEQNGAEISGYYDRSIRQVSTDGLAYRCSNATDFRVTTRYHLSGVVSGNHVILREKSFEILQASPCDSGRRNLDAYHGEAAIDELRLKWGVGSQVLRRERAEIPSQRF